MLFRSVKSYVDGKQMAPVLVLSNERLPAFKDVPTAREAGFDITLSQFRAIVMKAGTDPARVKTIADALAKVYNDPEYKVFLKDAMAFDASYVAADGAVAFMQGELDAMRKIVAALKK